MGASTAALAAVAVSRMSPEEKKAIVDFVYALVCCGSIGFVISSCVRIIYRAFHKIRKEKQP